MSPELRLVSIAIKAIIISAITTSLFAGVLFLCNDSLNGNQIMSAWTGAFIASFTINFLKRRKERKAYNESYKNRMVRKGAKIMETSHALTEKQKEDEIHNVLSEVIIDEKKQ